MRPEPVPAGDLWAALGKRYPRASNGVRLEDPDYDPLSDGDLARVSRLLRRTLLFQSVLLLRPMWVWTGRFDCEDYARLAACCASAWHAASGGPGSAPAFGTLRYEREDGGHTLNVVLTLSGLREWEPQRRGFADLSLEERMTATSVLF